MRKAWTGSTYSHTRCSELPARYATKSRDMTTSALPSTWVATCIRPVTSFGGAERLNPSHFGVRAGYPGDFRFNVVHLDGHVDDAVWMETRLSSGTGRRDAYWLFKQDNNFIAPYGWRYKTTSSPGYSDDAATNLEPIQGFPLAFDRNK
jgi:hypothetical protein